MPKNWQGETYFNAKEAAEYLEMPRDTFYANVFPQLTPYTYGGWKTKRYKQSDLDKWRGVKQVLPESSTQ